jgi:hypothetical protein
MLKKVERFADLCNEFMDSVGSDEFREKSYFSLTFYANQYTSEERIQRTLELCVDKDAFKYIPIESVKHNKHSTDEMIEWKISYSDPEHNITVYTYVNTEQLKELLAVKEERKSEQIPA